MHRHYRSADPATFALHDAQLVIARAYGFDSWHKLKAYVDGVTKSTLLGWACRWGRLELVKLFIGRDADPVEADSEAWATPRAWVQKMKHESVLRVLPEYRQPRT